MSTEILHKTEGSVTTVEATDTIVLDHAGVVRLKLGPELVERFDRVGDDLRLVLKDGRTITIRNFFVVDEDGERHDLVLEDGDEVLWWGQYTSPWTEFHFTEISLDHVVAPLLPDAAAGTAAAATSGGLSGWAVAALAVVGGGALAASGGGSDPLPAPEPPVPPPPAPANRPPQVPGYSHTIEEDTSASGRVSGSDPDGDTLTYRKGSDPSHGTVVVNEDGSYTYTPNPDYNGPDSFTVIVDDGKGGTTTSTVTIDVTPVNDPPAVPDYSHTIDEDTSATGRVSGTDPDDDTLTYRKGSDPSHGTLVVNGDGTYTYTPDPDYNGPDSFTVIVDDGNGGTTTSTVTIDVLPSNDPPTVPDYSHTIDEDTSATGRVSGTDPDDDTLTYRKGSDPSHGTVVVNEDGTYTYTPDPDYNGPDSFTVIVDDGNGGTTTSTVTIDVTPVNDPVLAGNDTYTTAEDTAVALDLLANDSAADGGLAITHVNGVALTGGAQTITVADGRVEIGADGGMRFVPAANFHGTTSFPYQVRDADGDTDTATVTITITPVNDAPVALAPSAPLDQADQDADAGIDVALDLPALFSDADGDTLTYSITGLPTGLSFDPATGRITGTIDNSASQDGPGGNGVHVVTLTATDPSGATATQTFTWTVTNPVPVATDDVNVSPEDEVVTGNVLTGAASGIGVNGPDSDPDGDALEVVSFVVDGDDTVHEAGATVMIPGVGTLVLDGDGDYTFTPVADWNGTVPTVTYTMTDGEGGSDTADLVITVTPVADVADDSAVTGASQPVTIDVLDNDSFEGEDASVTAIDGSPIAEGDTVAVGNGTVRLNADGTLTFTPADGFSGAASYTYTVTSGGVTETATVSIIVVDTEVTRGDVHEAGLPSGTLDNGSHVVNGSLDLPAGWSVIPASGTTAAGTWEVRADGTYTFTLSGATDEADLSQVTFQYRIENGAGLEVDQHVVITIHDDAPRIGLPGATGGLAVDESTLGSVASRDLSGLFDIHHGADGQGTAPVYGLSVDADLASGLVDSLTDEAVVLTVDGNTVTGTAGGLTVFTLTIDPATGEVELTQSRSVDHPDTGEHNEIATIADGAISLTVTVNDGDGDTATATHLIGGLIGFHDDGPSIDTSGTALGMVEVDESDLDADSGWVDFADAFAAVDYGNDGEGSLVHSVEIGDAATGLVDTATGRAVVLVQDGDVIEGRVSGGGNELVFTIEINGDGQVRLTQERAVRHADGEDHDDAVTLPAGSVVLRATATDGDGDSDSATVDVGDRFRFLDDGPSITGATGATVNEADLPTGSEPVPGPVAASGTLDVAFGADGAADIVFTTGTVAELLAAGLSAGGVALFYTLSEDGHTISATAGHNGPAVFTVEITTPTGATPGYAFTLHAALDSEDGADLTPQFLFRAVDRDGDHAEGHFIVTIEDDTPEDGERDIDVDEDGSVTFNTSADGNPDNTEVTSGPSHGTATVHDDGTITYVPAGNYSGTDSFTYTIEADDGSIVTITTHVTVNPVADAPGMAGTSHVDGNEDSDIALDLTLPSITDASDQNGPAAGDHGERLGAITLTLQGPSGGAETTGANLATAGGTPLIPNGSGGYTIVIVTTGTDVDAGLHIASGLPTENVNYLTRAEYEGLEARTGSEQHGNFRVQVQATSYEVDDSGVPRAGVDGATGTQIVNVGVQAVTDGIDLEIRNGSGDYVHADTPGTAVTIQMAEDAGFDLASLLRVTLDADADGRVGADTDGSEERWFVITGLPVGSIIDGHVITAAESTDGYRVDIEGNYNGDAPTLPPLRLTPPQDFSGTLSGIRITLNAQDVDPDGITGTATRGDILSDTVHVDLVVAPRAGDIAAGDVSTTEDNPVAFLQHVRVSDDSTTGGTEIIDSVSFELPEGWVLIEPTGSAMWSISGDGSSGAPYVITFNDGDAAQREAVLDTFLVQPPAHSSADAAVTVHVTSTDSNPATGAPPHTTTVQRTIGITVTPVAETTGEDSNGDGDNDVAITPGHDYTTNGLEDEWFGLNTDGFDLSSGWSNEDGAGEANGGPASGGSEQTFARLTPFGSDEATALDGSSFRYHDGTTWHTRVFNGEPVDIPLAYLDTLEFRGPLNFKGEVNIFVQAFTVDTDPDDGTVHTRVSGEAWLRNLELDPVADMVTLRVEARVVGQEDADIALAIQPSSSDPSEDYTVTIRGIPEGATLSYNGVPVPLVPGDGGTFNAVIPDFDPGVPLTLRPPANSNESIRLQVDAVSVDGTSDPSPIATLPIDITVRGVPDAAEVDVDNTRIYVEADLDVGGAVPLSDLVTAVRPGETPPDGSETVTLRISGLGEGFSVIGGGPAMGAGAGEGRFWVVTMDQITGGTVRIEVPENFSGTVSFTVQPVVTENDNPSQLFGEPQNITFEVTPSPEATFSEGSTVSEDTMGALDFSTVHRNGDVDEFISEVRFRVADGGPAGVTFHDADGNTLVAGGDGWYTVTGTGVDGVRMRGPANFSGEVVLDVQYRVTDPGGAGVDPVTSNPISGEHTVVVQPVTDAVGVDLDSIVLGTAGGTVGGDSVSLDAPGTVTVNLDIAKLADGETGVGPDHDGSERLTHIVVTGVPEGVSVAGATFTGDGSWLIQVGEDFDGPLDQAIQFVVHGSAGNVPPTAITITAYTQDGGAESETASTTWTLQTTFGPGDGEARLPTVALTATPATGPEDEAFDLSEAVSAVIDTTGANQPSFDMTVTLRTAPGDGTSFDHPDGITRVEVMEGGSPVVLWMVTVSNVTNETAQDALDAVLDAIEVNAPDHANRNNLGDPLELDVTVTLYNSALRNEGHVEAPVDIAPVTDTAVIDITAAPATEGEAVAISITVDSPADQDDWSLVDGRLYLRLGDGIDGELMDGSDVLTPAEVSGVPGLADGLYYVIEGVQPGVPVSLSFQPSGPFDSGSIALDAWVLTQETGGEPALATIRETLNVASTNTPPEVTATATGVEHDGSTVTRVQVQLDGAVLADPDEVLAAAFIEGLPADFAVYIGTDANSATLANNAGGGTWSIPLSNGSLPGYIAIQAPAHWSGSLPGVVFNLVSGEDDAAPTAWPVPLVIMVDPQADGLALSPTLSFGAEGERIALNLNAALVDPTVADGTDGHGERATLELSGFPDGELVRFYVGGTELGPDRASFSGGTWTLTGLTQAELDTLSFAHAGSVDVTIDVRARTQEYDNDGVAAGEPSDWVTGFVTINVRTQLPTTGDDLLLWTGDAIDGRAGHDAVLLREGSLGGDTLASRLRNVEELDLSSRGANSIEDLTPEQARQILGVDGTLLITGTDGDTLTLAGDWTWSGTSGGYVEYSSTSGATLRVSEAMTIDDGMEAFTAGSGRPMPMAMADADALLSAASTSGPSAPALVPFHPPAGPLDDLLEPVQMIV